MKIYYREKSGGIEILRCFGIEGRVEIPGMIDDKLVISAAPYAFSSHMDEKEELKNADSSGLITVSTFSSVFSILCSK